MRNTFQSFPERFDLNSLRKFQEILNNDGNFFPVSFFFASLFTSFAFRFEKSVLQELMHKLRVTEKSGKQQLDNEISRHASVRKKLNAAKEEIERLKAVIQVLEPFAYRLNRLLTFSFQQEKNKIVNRSNIYAHRFNTYGGSSRGSLMVPQEVPRRSISTQSLSTSPCSPKYISSHDSWLKFGLETLFSRLLRPQRRVTRRLRE